MRNRLLLLFAAVPLAAVTSIAYATVNTETRSVDYTCSGGTSYPVTFPFLETSHLKVTKYTGACDSATYSVLTEGSSNDYTVTRLARIPVGGVIVTGGGTVTTTAACDTGYCLRIQRIVPLTQTTSFRTQGTFLPAAHENEFDKQMMAIQQLQDGVAQSEDTAQAIEDHITASDDHTMYFKLAGRPGGQAAYGGTLAGNDLILGSNSAFNGTTTIENILALDSAYGALFADNVEISGDLYVHQMYGSDSSGHHAVYDSNPSLDGFVHIGNDTLVIDESNGYAGIGDDTPDAALDVVGSGLVSGSLTVPTVYGSGTTGQSLTLTPNSAAANGKVLFGASGAYDVANERLGINNTVPNYTLDVYGDASISSTLTVTGLVTSAAGYTTSSNVTTTGTGDMESGDDLIVHDDAAIGDTLTTVTVVASGTIGTVGTGDLSSADDLTVTGDATIGGDTVVTGYVAAKQRNFSVTTNQSLPTDAASCGALWSTATDGVIFLLANISATIDGCVMTFESRSATATISVAIDASDYMVGSCMDGSGKVDFDTATQRGIYNPAATNVQGDKVTVMADSTNNWWHILSCSGTWARLP